MAQSSVIARALTVLWLLTLSACSHFHMGNRFRTGADYVGARSPQTTGARKPSGLVREPSQPFRLTWPVTHVQLSRGFDGEKARPHQGIDIRGSKKSPIFAAHPGKVVYTGHDFRGYGNMVLIEYDKEWATLYGHLDEISIEEGARVMPGDLIGKMGRTGRATGVHLHFELMHYRQPVDPMPFLMNPQNRRAQQPGGRLRASAS